MGKNKMNTKVYVDNLAGATTARKLINLFSAYGNVVDVNLKIDPRHQQPCGFGCATMFTAEGARAAIEALNGRQVDLRTLRVREARPVGCGPSGA